MKAGSHGEAKTKNEADVPDKVFDFLQRIRGLNSMPPKELEQLLYDRRFELLGLPKQSSDAADKMAAKDCGYQQSLPEYSTIPSLHQLHEVLVSGIIPCGYQCVAHVLYPDSVAWPAQVSSAPGAESVQEPVAVASAPVDTRPASVPATSSSPGKQRAVPAGSIEGRQREMSDVEAVAKQAHDASGDAASAQKRPSAAEDPNNLEVERRSSRPPNLLLGSEQRAALIRENKENSSSFTLCGKKFSTSVRGKPVIEQNEDLLAVYAKAADDDSYNAAREERLRLERAVKLEQHQEKRLLEQIKNLDILRTSELGVQDEIRQRDARRLARKAELKKDLEDAWTIKLKKEAEEKALEKQEKEREAEEQKRLKADQEKQKQTVMEWRKEQAQRPVEENGLSRQQADKLAKEKQAKEKELEREKEKKSRPRSVKAQLADERVQGRLVALKESVEQRPPLPPRPHDLASSSPAAILLDGANASGGKASSQTARQRLEKEAKKVADNYGLTPRGKTAVESRLGRCIHASGRVAKSSEK